MDFSTYQKLSLQTAIYPDRGSNYFYPTLGLCGEAGEVAEKVKKIIRDNNGVIEYTQRAEIEKELGDVLWYLTQIATELNLSLETVATSNINKLLSRTNRNMIHGDGDNR